MKNQQKKMIFEKFLTLGLVAALLCSLLAGCGDSTGSGGNRYSGNNAASVGGQQDETTYDPNAITGIAGAEIDFRLANGVLTLSGKGAMNDYERDYDNTVNTPWFKERERIKKIVIEPGITHIGACAFYHCFNATSIEIPDTVMDIGELAFYQSGLQSVTIPNSVTRIGDHAFNSCNGLTSITIPNSVTSLGVGVFVSCSGLTSITIPRSITSLDDLLFSDCTALGSITIPDSVTSIGESTFKYCTGLSSVTIPKSVTRIGNYAFDGCSGLQKVTIDKGVTSIGNRAFFDCDSLDEAVYLGTEERWNRVSVGVDNDDLLAVLQFSPQ